MKWSIPAKTFFLGEYAAITGAPAILLTTTPCFELTLTETSGLNGIHPHSPAGRFWIAHNHDERGLSWHDPYNGCGGLGASSAQWLAACFAHHYLQKKSITREQLLQLYFKSVWQGEGTRPSGYDMLAQSLHGCVYINHKKNQYSTYDWPFSDLAFILLHTGQKLATHHHLQSLTLTNKIDSLVAIIDAATVAFESADSTRIIESVNAYHQCLMQHHLVADHSLQLIDLLSKQDDVLAMKGCGAMGADVLLVLVPADKLVEQCLYFSMKGMQILATSDNLYNEPDFLSNNSSKILDILV